MAKIFEMMMVFIRRLILWLVVLCLLIFVGASIFLQFYGKKVLEDTLSQKLNTDVRIGTICYQFPLGFSASRIVVNGIFGTDGLSAQFSPEGIRKRQIHFQEIVLVRPSVPLDKVIGKGKESSREETDLAAQTVPGRAVEKAQKISTPKIFIDHLVIHNGEFSYHPDNTAYDFMLKDAQVKLGNLVIPLSDNISQFDIMAKFVKEKSPLTGSRVEGKGWINLSKRDMEANFKIGEASGKAGLTANVISKNNDMTVAGTISAGNLIEKLVLKQSEKTEAFNKMLFDSLSSFGVTVEAKYSFETKMDHFKLDNIAFSGTVSGIPGAGKN